MAKTDFRVVPIKDGTYSVEITERKALPHRVGGFATEVDARTWIKRELRERTQKAMTGVLATAKTELKKRRGDD